jgi:hypothetical protein
VLNRELAQRRLAEIRNDRVRPDAAARLATLPRPLRELGDTLLGPDPSDLRQLQRFVFDDRLPQAYAALDRLPPRRRRRLFGALLPQLGDAVDAAWLALRSDPYQLGHLRRAFRAPNDPEITLPGRGAWLLQLLHTALPFERDALWFAAWAPHLPHHGAPDALGRLFVPLLDRGDAQSEALFRVLVDSATGVHEVGAMGRHVTRALLGAADPAGWELIESTLLAAQRQEGLRQVILETIDEAHPQAFARMIRLLRAERMSRFAATVRALAVWFGFELDSARPQEVDALLDGLTLMLEDPAARRRARTRGDAHDAYLALWSHAFEDAPGAVALAAPLLSDPDPERRYVAAHLLAQLGLESARRALLPALDDDDLRIVARALDAFTPYGAEGRTLDLFSAMRTLLPRIPKSVTLEPIVWPWNGRNLTRSNVAFRLSQQLGERPATDLAPYLGEMDADGRAFVARQLAGEAVEKGVDGARRALLLQLVGDVSQYVRLAALETLAEVAIAPDEAPALEALLERKAGDLRRGVLGLLLRQPDDGALASAERLLASGKAPPRLAGLELLRELIVAERVETGARAMATAFRDARTPTQAEATLLAGIASTDEEPATLDDGLGLFDPAVRTSVLTPTVRPGPFTSPVVPRLIAALDDLIDTERETPVKLVGWRGDRTELLGNLHALWQPLVWRDGRRVANDEPPPLAERWLDWWRERPAELRDEDGLELPRSLAALSNATPLPLWSHLDRVRRTMFTRLDPLELRHERLTRNLLTWLAEAALDGAAIGLLLDGAETTLALLPPDTFGQPEPALAWQLRDPRHSPSVAWFEMARAARRRPELWSRAQEGRLWRLLRSYDEGLPGGPRLRPRLDEVLDAWRRGDANDHDLADHLIGPRPETGRSWGYQGFHDLRRLTGLKPDPDDTDPALLDLVDRIRERVLAVESARGDLPSAAARPALSLRSIRGARHALTLLKGLGRATLMRGYSYDSLGKASVFSRLIRASFPTDDETPERFAALAAERKLSEKRLLELAMYAPQWAPFVERTLGWPGLEEAGYWLHAHTKDTSWTVDPQVREVWVAEVSERTPLNAQELLDGAVDVAWFRRSRAGLPDERWQALYAAAKYASGGGGHKRAQLFADALEGRIAADELLPRIEGKRHQDAVRALGLLPLPDEDSSRQDEILRRYQIVQRFLKGSRIYGPQRRASERLAADIALENLARSAGAVDAQRLAWAMEAREVADLTAGPLLVREGEIEIGLRIDPTGEPLLEVTKGGRPLKRVPVKLRKRPEIVTLTERRKGLVEQAARMRTSLEEAMVRGSAFTPDELDALLRHPLLRPQLGALVLISEDGALGTPVDGRTLMGADGSEVTLGATSVRVAHPSDLLAAGADVWAAWQRACFERERPQPFKQLFRELYPLTAAEREGERASRRYEGHQLNPRQALALLGKRGWVSVPDEGARRTFHHEGISVHATFLEGFATPADVDGITLAEVLFTRRGEGEPLDLAAVSTRLFSEAMRDLDLAVSVAHRGGVDPEASAGTVEMRRALLRETLTLLRLGNVRLEGAHALIDGVLGRYSVHLGSAVAHRQPGGALAIVPVHSQQRGRLFLPFADDDPKTAEVVAKVVLLAQDDEIRDPTILEQLAR